MPLRGRSKALPQAANTHVIGIKYDLLDEGEPGGKGTATPVQRKEPKPRPPALKVFAVTVLFFRRGVIGTLLAIDLRRAERRRVDGAAVPPAQNA